MKRWKMYLGEEPGIINIYICSHVYFFIIYKIFLYVCLLIHAFIW